jgi:glycosyltransferase involved in cell wall biosynthesis
MTKVSFIVPAHNEERYIAKTLESIFAEIKRADAAAEVIVVNNASTDQTAHVAASYSSVRVIEEQRLGTSYARMAGFLASNGDIVACVDADTEIAPGWITTVQDEFNRSNKLVAISGPCRYDVSLPTNLAIALYYLCMYGMYLINHRLFGGSSLLMFGNAAFRRSALENIGGYNTTLTFYGDDTDVAKRLSKLGIVKFAFGLRAATSGRRLRSQGLLQTACTYALNYAWVLFFNKPFTTKAVHVREN